MLKKQNILIVLLIVFILYIFYKNYYDGTVPVKSSIDSTNYNVIKDKDYQVKANNLAILKIKLNAIVDSLRTSDSLECKRLVQKWDLGISMKETGKMENDAAYVINKKNMSICLREKPSGGNLENINILTYVAIHELAHIMSVEIGHGNEFIKNFKYLLEHSASVKYKDPIDSVEKNVYTPPRESKSFCGVDVRATIF